jgi:Na+-translocating ferredoxin:NAD+ oxidoreductase RnfA subunit
MIVVLNPKVSACGHIHICPGLMYNYLDICNETACYKMVHTVVYGFGASGSLTVKLIIMTAVRSESCSQ